MTRIIKKIIIYVTICLVVVTSLVFWGYCNRVQAQTQLDSAAVSFAADTEPDTKNQQEQDNEVIFITVLSLFSVGVTWTTMIVFIRRAKKNERARTKK